MKYPLSAIKNTQPRREHGDIEALKASIKDVGLVHPPTVDENLNLLAGRRRYQALVELYGPDYQVDVTVLPVNGDRLKAFKVAIEENLRRKPLTDPEVATAIKEYDEMKREIEGKRQAGGDRQSINYARINDTGWTQAQTAADLGISQPAVVRAIQIATAIEEHPDLAKLTSGQALLREYRQRKLAESLAANPLDGLRPTIASAHYADWLPQQPGCDLLLTDPPYSTEIQDIRSFAQDWLPLALSKVKPTGRAYIFIGAYPRELEAYLSVKPDSLVLANILVWAYENTLGPHSKFDYNLNWQAVLYYRGTKAPLLDCPLLTEQFAVHLVNAPDGRTGVRYSPWEKPNELAQRFIRHSTQAGDLVLDCFAGTGTFLLAAANLGRQARGCDISQEMINIAVKRGCTFEA